MMLLVKPEQAVLVIHQTHLRHKGTMAVTETVTRLLMVEVVEEAHQMLVEMAPQQLEVPVVMEQLQRFLEAVLLMLAVVVLVRILLAQE
jgi:hypothetical protein